jgi:ATP adenylyltransferase
MRNGHQFQTKFATENYDNARNFWDVPVFESKDFAALPTVGALVEGWLLIVPKAPAISFAKLSNSQFAELEVFLSDIVSVMESVYGTVSVFEHGPSTQGSCIGCGVDYAHLHIVPVQCDLLAEARRIAPNIKWKEIPSLEAVSSCIESENGYWFLKQDFRSDACYIGTAVDGKPTSQLFRKVIAASIGCPSAYDWKQHLGEQNIIATVRKLNHNLQPA